MSRKWYSRIYIWQLFGNQSQTCTDWTQNTYEQCQTRIFEQKKKLVGRIPPHYMFQKKTKHMQKLKGEIKCCCFCCQKRIFHTFSNWIPTEEKDWYLTLRESEKLWIQFFYFWRFFPFKMWDKRFVPSALLSVWTKKTGDIYQMSNIQKQDALCSDIGKIENLESECFIV